MLCAIGTGMARSSHTQVAERPVNIVAFGDCLRPDTEPANEAFPAQLQRALDAKGLAVKVVNAGVSGDHHRRIVRLIGQFWTAPTPSSWNSANDALRGLNQKLPARPSTRCFAVKERKISVLLCGMVAPPIWASNTAARSTPSIDLAAQTGAILYPFFLTGVATDPSLNQRDGLHPTAAGVAVIVDGILPQVEELIARAKASRVP
jgi:acyl-CoA thioesterase-1